MDPTPLFAASARMLDLRRGLTSIVGALGQEFSAASRSAAAPDPWTEAYDLATRSVAEAIVECAIVTGQAASALLDMFSAGFRAPGANGTEPAVNVLRVAAQRLAPADPAADFDAGAIASIADRNLDERVRLAQTWRRVAEVIGSYLTALASVCDDVAQTGLGSAVDEFDRTMERVHGDGATVLTRGALALANALDDSRAGTAGPDALETLGSVVAEVRQWRVASGLDRLMTPLSVIDMARLRGDQVEERADGSVVFIPRHVIEQLAAEGSGHPESG